MSKEKPRTYARGFRVSVSFSDASTTQVLCPKQKPPDDSSSNGLPQKIQMPGVYSCPSLIVNGFLYIVSSFPRTILRKKREIASETKTALQRFLLAAVGWSILFCKRLFYCCNGKSFFLRFVAGFFHTSLLLLYNKTIYVSNFCVICCEFFIY